MSLRNVLYCKVEPEHNQSGPKRPASHNCQPTLPRPPAMSPCSELNVRTLPPANIAPGAAGTNRQCTTQPSAAPPTRNRTRRAMPPMPAQPPPPSVSCHEKHATDTILRTFCTKTTFFAYFLSKTDRYRILLRESMPISCHEESDNSLKVRPFRPKQRIRYPIDTLSIPDFREIRSRFASHPDVFRKTAYLGGNQAIYP